MLLPRREIDVVVVFLNEYFADEWNAESRRRFQTYCELWDECGPFYWIASCGLSNKLGTTIAQSIIQAFVKHDIKTSEYLIGIEEVGVDTVTQLQEIRPLFESFERSRPDRPELFAVSDKLHLWNMIPIARRLGFELQGIPSPMTGGIRYKIGRLATEGARRLFGLTDPCFKHPRWERMRQIRIERAKARVPGENYFHT